MQQLEATNQPLIEETIRIIHALAELYPVEARARYPLSIWVHHYAGQGTQLEKARTAASSLATYKSQLANAECICSKAGGVIYIEMFVIKGADGSAIGLVRLMHSNCG